MLKSKLLFTFVVIKSNPGLHEMFSSLSNPDQRWLVSGFPKRFARKNETRHEKWNYHFPEPRESGIGKGSGEENIEGRWN